MQFILEEDSDSGYHKRTEVNAMLSDVTFAIAIKFDSSGQKLTKALALKHNKLYLPIQPSGDIFDKASKIVAKINQTFNGVKHSIGFNIAGNGLFTMKGTMTQEQCDAFTYELLFAIINHSDLKVKIKSIRSGGQTGFDLSGLRAGIKLKLDTIAYFPKGFLIRDIDGDKKMTREQAFKYIGIRQRKKVMVDMDGVMCDFLEAYLMWKKNHPQIEYPQSQFGFFSNLKPIENSIESFKELEKYFDVYILTRPSIYNLMCYTEKADWINRHLGFDVLENLIIACDKSLLKGDYLIDDTVQAGQLDFEGEFIQFASDKFKDWNAILKYLIPQK